MGSWWSPPAGAKPSAPARICHHPRGQTPSLDWGLTPPSSLTLLSRRRKMLARHAHETPRPSSSHVPRLPWVARIDWTTPSPACRRIGGCSRLAGVLTAPGPTPADAPAPGLRVRRGDAGGGATAGGTPRLYEPRTQRAGMAAVAAPLPGRHPAAGHRARGRACPRRAGEGCGGHHGQRALRQLGDPAPVLSDARV